MSFNLADLFEQAVDHFGERECLVANGVRRSYAQMEARANRLAHHLAAHGIGAGDHVGIYAQNRVEWVETLWAVFKLRGVWININYRYVEDELRYLVGNADLKALVAERQYAPRVAAVRSAMPQLEHLIWIEDGSEAERTAPDAIDFEAALTLAAIQAHCRDQLAGYKLPRQLTLVDAIERSPAGKPDYRWAQRVATGS